MDDENKELDLELDEGGDDTSDTSQVDVNALIEQNKKLYARAKQAESKLKEKKPDTQVTSDNPSPIKPMDILRDETFALYREGYDNDEIELIIRNGGRKILEDENSPITLGLRAKKEQRQAEKAASQANGNAELSEVERKYTPEQLANMSAKELEEILPKAD
jgi:hypothetical protein